MAVGSGGGAAGAAKVLSGAGRRVKAPAAEAVRKVRRVRVRGVET
jgi:hypothetical protein